MTKTPTQTPSIKLNATHSQDVAVARLSKVTDPKLNRNPLAFTDPIDRQAATLARAQHIIGSEQYKKLDSKNQAHLLSRYFDKYVAPGYAEKGFNVPDKDNWVRTMHNSPNAYKPDDYYAGHWGEAAQSYVSSLEGNTAKMINVAGQFITKQAFMSLVGLEGFYTGHVDTHAVKQADILAKHANKISQDWVDSSNFWFNTHPTKQWQAQMASASGDILASLPLYEALGAARLAAGAKIAGTSNLTAKLATSKAGSFVAKRLGDASDAFFGSLISGKSTGDSAKDAASYTALVTGGSLATKGLKWAGSGLIKRFSALVATQGGHVLQDALTGEAQHIFDIQSKIAKSGLNSLSAEEKLAYHEHVNGADPLKAKLVLTEQHVLDSMAKVAHGTPFKDLDQESKNGILAQRNILHAQGIAEVSIHAPEEAKALISKNLEQDMKDYPMLGQTVAKLKEMGVDVTDALHEAEVEKVVKETGIQSSQATLKKVSKVKIPSLTPEQVAANRDSAKAYVQFKVDNLRYLKNNFNFKGKSSDKQLANFLDGMDTKDFLGVLNDETGNQVKFENPEHQLLWANQFREQLPKPLAKRIQEELHDLDPTGTHALWDQKSKNLAAHMQELAYTGHLFNEGNVFRTTRVDNWTSKTKFQKMLRQETEQQEMANLKLVTGKYPKAYKAAATLMKALQADRRRVKTVDEYMRITKGIRDIKIDKLKEAVE